MPTVLITGGTGLVGKNLTRHLANKGYDVIILSRSTHSYNNARITYAAWNIEEQKIDADAILKADYIIHLAGAGVMDKKWSEKYKKEIVASRTKSSELLIKVLKENTNKIKAIISASAIGWYGEDDKPVINKNGFIETAPPAKNFLGQTCRLWEESVEPVTALHKRLVKLRTGIVLSNHGGAFPEFVRPLRFGMAAILGNGKQAISWIHIEDICRMYIYAIENEHISGTYNAVAPSPISNKKFILKLAEKLRGQFYIPMHVPQFLLKVFLGERSIEIFKSTTVSCEKIKNTGFTFLYPSVDAALTELTKKE
ncbi:MAG: TIGR01777 family oxidoreductase [Bacteroidota bacterium]|nr:TIGR01777 family oxidoreductase [Bacteroidota bacterium]